MVELYQDTLIDLLLPKNAKRLKLDIKKDSKVFLFFMNFIICCFIDVTWSQYLRSSFVF